MKAKEVDLYMNLARNVAILSHAKRLQVGAVLAKPGGILISYGYNGTPAGMDNCCEYPEGKTKPEVIHAEMNAILKACREGRSTVGSWLFLTHSPCIDCAKLVLQAGITNIVYGATYRKQEGLAFLITNNIKVQYKPYKET